MSILLTSGSYAQFLSVLLIFVAVLGVTVWVTRWTANYQKLACTEQNIEVIETARIAGNKYVQIVRVGEEYLAIAICKDTVTMLSKIPADQIKKYSDKGKMSFQELFDKSLKKNSSDQREIEGKDDE